MLGGSVFIGKKKIHRDCHEIHQDGIVQIGEGENSNEMARLEVFLARQAGG
jgi:hypothetical protein